MADIKNNQESDSETNQAALLREVIAASNRTTHAVRAIVLPSTIVLVALLISLPLVLFFFLSQAPAFAVLGGLVLFIGGILAISAQISETRLSNIAASSASAGPTSTAATPPQATPPQASSPTKPAREPDTTPEPEHPNCQCSVLERGLGGVQNRAGVKTCLRCGKPL